MVFNQKIFLGLFLYLGSLKLSPGTVGLGFFDLLSFLVVLTSFGIKIPREKFYRYGFLLLAIGFVQVFSFFLNFLLFKNTHWDQVFYSMRFFQYFLLIPFLGYCSRFISAQYFCFFSFSIFVSILFSKFVFDYKWGFFQYSWELGAISSLLLALLISLPDRPKGLWFYIVLLAGMVLYANQRSPVLAVVLIAIYFLFFMKNKIAMSAKAIVVFTVILLFFLLFYTDSRFSSFFENATIGSIIDAFSVGSHLANYATSYDSFVYHDRSLLTESGDLSFHLRIRKWAFAASEMSLLGAFIGLGPGYFGGAADSSLVRAVFETGLIGLSLWLLLVIRLWRDFPGQRIIMIAFLSNCLFIDSLYSSRIFVIFVVLFLFSINIYARKNKNIDSHSKL